MEMFRDFLLVILLTWLTPGASLAETPDSCDRAVDAHFLDRAAWSGDLFGIQLLLDRDADPNGAPEAEIVRCFHGRPVSPPIMQAAHQGHVEILQLLLAAGADPNVWCCDSSAVQAAAANGHTEAVRLLLAAGAKREGAANAARDAGHDQLAKEIEAAE